MDETFGFKYSLNFKDLLKQNEDDDEMTDVELNEVEIIPVFIASENDSEDSVYSFQQTEDDFGNELFDIMADASYTKLDNQDYESMFVENTVNDDTQHTMEMNFVVFPDLDSNIGSEVKVMASDNSDNAIVSFTDIETKETVVYGMHSDELNKFIQKGAEEYGWTSTYDENKIYEPEKSVEEKSEAIEEESEDIVEQSAEEIEKNDVLSEQVEKSSSQLETESGSTEVSDNQNESIKDEKMEKKESSDSKDNKSEEKESAKDSKSEAMTYDEMKSETKSDKGINKQSSTKKNKQNWFSSSWSKFKKLFGFGAAAELTEQLTQTVSTTPAVSSQDIFTKNKNNNSTRRKMFSGSRSRVSKSNSKSNTSSQKNNVRQTSSKSSNSSSKENKQSFSEQSKSDKKDNRLQQTKSDEEIMNDIEKKIHGDTKSNDVKNERHFGNKDKVNNHTISFMAESENSANFITRRDRNAFSEGMHNSTFYLDKTYDAETASPIYSLDFEDDSFSGRVDMYEDGKMGVYHNGSGHYYTFESENVKNTLDAMKEKYELGKVNQVEEQEQPNIKEQEMLNEFGNDEPTDGDKVLFEEVKQSADKELKKLNESKQNNNEPSQNNNVESKQESKPDSQKKQGEDEESERKSSINHVNHGREVRVEQASKVENQCVDKNGSMKELNKEVDEAEC